jgi:hypothetical protein
VILYDEAGSGMHSCSREAGFTRLWGIQGMISASLTAWGWTKQQTSSGALMVEHSIPLPRQHPWFIRVRGSCQANGDSLSYLFIQLLIFKRVNPRAFICCLRLRSSPVSLRSPLRPLTKGGSSKRILKGERPVHLVGLDLILSKAVGAN